MCGFNKTLCLNEQRCIVLCLMIVIFFCVVFINIPGCGFVTEKECLSLCGGPLARVLYKYACMYNFMLVCKMLCLYVQFYACMYTCTILLAIL